MDEIASYKSAVDYLNLIFDLLNEAFFENTLSKPTITIQSTPRAYGHFTLNDDTWISKNGNSHEINIGAGTLARPIKNTCATLMHEMCHYWNYINGIQDCSRGNTYHNRKFKDAAEAHGLIVEHDDKYGWSHTEPNEVLQSFINENALQDILINRNEMPQLQVTGKGSQNGAPFSGTAPKTSSSRKYICPSCGNSIRATKKVNIACMDCNEQMVEI